MQTEDFEYLNNLEESFWWFTGMREISASLLEPLFSGRESLVLDIGCGTGGNLKWLARYIDGSKIVGIDIAPKALEFCRINNHRLLAQASATALPFAAELFDLVTSFDVLVQIPGENADRQAICEMHRVLRPGGIAFVRVAAYQWMRSEHDRVLNTQRRYKLEELQSKLESAGFTILRATYANSILLPVAAIHRLILKPFGLVDRGSDVKPLPSYLKWLNWSFTSVLQCEARLLRTPQGKLHAGLSAICIVKKAGKGKAHHHV
jgi:SAM-dependent methyltransferase